jgi:hypothetical protein
MVITIKGDTPDRNALEAVKLLGQRTANETLAAVRMLPHWQGVGPAKVTLSISVNDMPVMDLPFVGLVQDRQSEDEDPFGAM